MCQYHVVHIDYFVTLLPQLPHYVVTCVLGLGLSAVHHPEAVSLVIGLAVEIEHSFPVGHDVGDYAY